MKESLFLVLMLAAMIWWVTHSPADLPPPGVLAPDDPLQTETSRPEWDRHGYHFKALAEYVVKARVLSREAYWFDRGSALAPWDFALGWGRMSDAAIYGKLNIRQSGRFYYYTWPGSPPIPEDEIVRSSANTHLIPANPQVKAKLELVQAGDVVRLIGCLVEVTGPNEWHWRSSTSRADSGNGACELLWVENVYRLGR